MDAARPSALQGVAAHVWLRRGLGAYILWPLATLFGLLVALRRALYRTGVLRVRRVAVPVIVVGNVVAGGAGKTPVVIALVQHLHQRGLRVGVVSRGYGRQSSACSEVLAESAALDVGDEPVLIKRNTAAQVFVAAKRHQAAQALLERHPETDVIICDDGLQHLGLHRDLEICVFDERGVGNGLLLPAGPLREPWPRAVDLVLHTAAQPAFAGFTATRALGSHALRADGSELALSALAAASAKPLLAVAAIARPEGFFAMLREKGLTLAKTLALPDHHDFADWSSANCADHIVVCTEKDAVKLWARQADALAIPLRLRLEPAFLAKLDAIIAAWKHDC